VFGGLAARPVRLAQAVQAAEPASFRTERPAVSGPWIQRGARARRLTCQIVVGISWKPLVFKKQAQGEHSPRARAFTPGNSAPYIRYGSRLWRGAPLPRSPANARGGGGFRLISKASTTAGRCGQKWHRVRPEIGGQKAVHYKRRPRGFQGGFRHRDSRWISGLGETHQRGKLRPFKAEMELQTKLGKPGAS